MVNNKNFSHRPISELISIVKNDLRRFDAQSLIDEGTLVKTVMYCNDKLGISIREVKEVAIPVNEFKAKLPLDFEKLYYVCALQATNTMVHTQVNPFDNTVDHDLIDTVTLYEAKLDRDCLGKRENFQLIVKRESNTTIHNHGTWIELDVNQASAKSCHISCPNTRKKGKYSISIKDEYIETPFRSGTLYLMYIGAMKDENGEILFPFHPIITPWYEWSVKHKILLDAAFNSDIDSATLKGLLEIASSEKTKAWLDAFNITMERSYIDFVEFERQKELKWYNEYFKYFQ